MMFLLATKTSLFRQKTFTNENDVNYPNSVALFDNKIIFSPMNWF